MRIEDLRFGQRVKHPGHGLGTVKAISEHTIDVRFDDGVLRTISPIASGLTPSEPTITANGLDVPMATFIRQTVEATASVLGLQRPEGIVEQLASRWHGGRIVMHPHDPTLTTKEVELEVFFHKIVMLRNNLRVLEQKVNAHAGLADSEKFELQQYITKCYGSMTTFNLLFKEKEDYF